MSHETQIAELEARADKLQKNLAQLDKAQAVKLHQYDEVCRRLKDLGVDVENKKVAEIKAMLVEQEQLIKQEAAALEEIILQSEAVVAEFQALQN